MTDPTVTDLRRELAKAAEALTAAERHLARQAEANAAAHLAERVMYSPLHAKVTATLAGIDHALARTEQAPDTEPRRDLAGVLLDLDRCRHGRHQGDDCVDCGGRSHGNPHAQPGTVIGHSLRRGDIVMPDRDDKHDPANWYRAEETGPR